MQWLRFGEYMGITELQIIMDLYLIPNLATLNWRYPMTHRSLFIRDFFTTLDQAVATLKANPGQTAFGNNDQIYGGDSDKWLKFAATLRLRLAMRVKFVDPGLAQSRS